MPWINNCFLDWPVEKELEDLSMILDYLKISLKLRRLSSFSKSNISALARGTLPYKNDGGAHGKFWKEPLKGTRISISGRGPE